MEYKKSKDKEKLFNELNNIKEIVYPIKNNTHQFWKRCRYDIILRNGNKYYIYDSETINLLQLLLKWNGNIKTK